MAHDRICELKTILVRTSESESAKSMVLAVAASRNRQLCLGVLNLEPGRMVQNLGGILDTELCQLFWRPSWVEGW